MNAHIAHLARALRRRNSPAVVTYLVGHPSIKCQPRSRSQDASGEVEVALVAGEPSKSKKRKRKHKHRGKSSSKSSKRSSKQSEHCAAKEAVEEEENTKYVKELVAWWKQAHEDLKTPSSKVAEMEGEKLNPDWAISARSSALRTHVGQDSFELFKACCLEHDQVLLAQTARARVEEHLAYVLMQTSAFGHNLSLKCSMFRNDKENEALEAKIALDARVPELEAKVADLEAQLASTIEENKKVVADALERGHTDGFSAGRFAGKTEGLNEGCEAYLQSKEHKKSISKTRLQGTGDFLKASTLQDGC
ncbi:hypothetical protein Salat_1911300 [Sesamum alatum]|uniref:Uncharacterized protein n=1 Tax=Sesamum alatum TaxID=300844 RepID=A0AAE1Y447_9LAMI|nr:hypothetical protein Salat_1911300 [Sesamum alatum]